MSDVLHLWGFRGFPISIGHHSAMPCPQDRNDPCRRFSSYASFWCHKIFARAAHVKSDTLESSMGQRILSKVDDSLPLFAVHNHSATLKQTSWRNTTSRVCARFPWCSDLEGHVSKCKAKCLVAEPCYERTNSTTPEQLPSMCPVTRFL